MGTTKKANRYTLSAMEAELVQPDFDFKGHILNFYKSGDKFTEGMALEAFGYANTGHTSRGLRQLIEAGQLRIVGRLNGARVYERCGEVSDGPLDVVRSLRSKRGRR